MFLNYFKKIKGLIFVFVITCSFAQTNKSVLNIQSWQTNNGAHVLYVHAPEIPMVEINAVFDAGSARDGKQWGIAQLTNSMLDQGTAQMSADQIADRLDSVGAQLNTQAGRDMSVVNLESLSDPKYLTPALDVFSQILSSSNFPKDAFVRTQKQMLAAIAQQQQTPDTVANNTFYAALYADNPYGHPILGKVEIVSQLTTTDLINFYKKYYVAKNTLITMVGDISRQQAEAIANQLTANLPQGAAPSPLPYAAAVTKPALQKISFPSEQTNIFIGQIGINYQDPHYFPLLVGNYILGGAPMTSLLFNQVREQRGLAYSVGSGFMPYAAKGPFAVILQTRNDKAQQAVQIVQDVMNNFIKNGATQAQLAAAQKKIINGFPLTLAGNDAISSQLVKMGFYHLPLNYLDTYRQKISAVTLEQIKASLQQTIHPEKLITIMVGNSS